MSSITPQRLTCGVAGLDAILNGGFIPQRSYLIRGGPGTGKTTLGLHFLTANPAETSLYITFGEKEESIRSNAQAVGFNCEQITFLDLSPDADFFELDQTYTLFDSSEVEQSPVQSSLEEAIQSVRPERIVIDSMTQFRILISDDYQYRKYILSFLNYLTEQGATVLFTSEHTAQYSDDDLQFQSDGIISLAMNAAQHRTLQITKYRGSDFHKGTHDVQITDTGLQVYPQIIPGTRKKEPDQSILSSGVSELDVMLHGGLEVGTVTLITGPTGVGKTTTGIQFLYEASQHGQKTVLYSFEESADILFRRSKALNLPLAQLEKEELFRLHEIDPARQSTGEVTESMRREVERNQVDVVMIDSIDGFHLTVHDQRPNIHLQQLCKYLTNHGVTVILIHEIQNITGHFHISELGVSWFVDNVLFLRYLELDGELRKAVGVLKKRLSDFERLLREYRFTAEGVQVGEPLTGLRGILLGTPETD